MTADWRYLLGAGLIMVLALMFSKKARTVTDTEVNLARQGGGVERFGSVPPARMMVRYALNASRVVEKIMPASVGRFIEKRFQPVSEGPDNGASFDLIRASVNLTVAALLISLATSLKLPLSTTYVTFMVAMGSSLADKAWGRDSAVYRITGVITVISGWFFTAFAAFAMCCMVAACIVYGGVFGIITMCVLAAYLLLKSARLHRKRTQAAELVKGRNYADASSLSRYNEEIIELMKRMAEIYEMNLEALNVEDRKRLKKLRKESRGIRRSLGDKMAMEVMPVVQELRDGEADRGKRHVQMVEYATSVFESLSNITTASHAYIDNNHEGLDMEYIEDLRKMNNRVSSLYPRFRDMMETNDYSGLDECLDGIDALDEEFAEAVKRQIILRTENVSDMRRTLLYLNLLNETRTMIRKVLLLAKVQKKFVLGADGLSACHSGWWFSIPERYADFSAVPLVNSLCSALSKKTKAAKQMDKTCGMKSLVRAMGIEPTSQAWEARVLPLNDARTICAAFIYRVKRGMSRQQNKLRLIFLNLIPQ